MNAPANRIFTLDADSLIYYNISSWAQTTIKATIINHSSFIGGRDDLASYVPIPGTLLILGDGLVRLVAYARRRQE